MKIQIIDFTAAHIEQAKYIAKQNYEAERKVVPALPPVDAVPDLTPYAENDLGVAAAGDIEIMSYRVIPDSFSCSNARVFLHRLLKQKYIHS